MPAVAAILVALARLAPWLIGGFWTWELAKTGAADAIAKDVEKVANAGGKVADMAKEGAGGGLLIAVALGLVAFVVVKG